MRTFSFIRCILFDRYFLLLSEKHERTNWPPRKLTFCHKLSPLDWIMVIWAIFAQLVQFWMMALFGPFWGQKGTFRDNTRPFGVPGGPEEARYKAKVCGNHDSNSVRPIGSSWDQIWPLWGAQKLFSQLGSFWGQMGPFGPHVGTWKGPIEGQHDLYSCNIPLWSV